VLPELTASAQARVDALLDEELATATASFDCRQGGLEAEQEVRKEYEAEFVVEYEGQIAEIFPTGSS